MLSFENLTLVNAADAIRDDDEQATATGNMLIRMLSLKPDKAYKDTPRYVTAWGSKTPAGLARTIVNVIEGSRITTAKDREAFGT